MAKGITLPIVFKSDTKGLKEAQVAVDGFERKIGVVNKLLSGAMVAAAGVATAAVGGLSFALTKGFGRLQDIENAEFKLRGLGHTAESVEQIMSDALSAVKGTAFGMGEAASIAASAVAAGVKPGQELAKYLTLTADAAAIANVPLGEMGAILNKVTTANRAYTMELTQLADRGIPIFQAIADVMGVTAAEVRDLASDGAISSEILATALENTLGGAAKRMGESLQGAFANTIAAIGRIGANLLGPVYDQFGEFFNAAIEGLAPVEEAAARVGESIGNYLNPKLDELIDGVRNLSPLISTAIATFATFRDRVGGVVEFFRPLVELFLETISQLPRLTPIIASIADILSGILVQAFDTLVVIFEQLNRDLIPTLITLFEEVLPPLVDLAETAANLLVPVILTLAEIAIPILVAVIKVLTPILDVLAKMAQSLDGFLVILVGTIYAGVKAFAAYKAIMTVVTAMQLGYQIALAGSTGATFLNTNAQKAGLIIGQLLTGQLFQNIGARVAEKAALIASTTATIAQSVATRAAAAAQWAMNVAMTANPIGLVVAALVALIAGLAYFFTMTETGRQAWAAFTEFLTATTTALAEWFIYTFTEAIPAAWNYFTTSISAIWSETLATMGERFGAFGDFFKGIINGLTGIFAGYINSIISGVNWLIKAINKIQVKIPDWDIFGSLRGKTFGINIPLIPQLNIPKLAEGGIVDKATLAMIGEAGPEAVVPLDRSKKMGSTYNITVNAGMGADGSRIGEEIIRQITRYERLSGPVFARA